MRGWPRRGQNLLSRLNTLSGHVPGAARTPWMPGASLCPSSLAVGTDRQARPLSAPLTARPLQVSFCFSFLVCSFPKKCNFKASSRASLSSRLREHPDTRGIRAVGSAELGGGLVERRGRGRAEGGDAAGKVKVAGGGAAEMLPFQTGPLGALGRGDVGTLNLMDGGSLALLGAQHAEDTSL